MTLQESGPNGHIYLVSATPEPIGKFAGALSTTPATELGSVAIRAAVARAGLPNAPARKLPGPRSSPADLIK